MTSFSDQPWEVRRGSMGHEAESKFEELYSNGFTRIGHDLPPIDMRQVHPYERARPDYLVSGKYIEVMGVGRDQILKVKLEKLEALRFWKMLHPVLFWVWDSANKRVLEFTLEDVEKAAKIAPIKRFPEGTAYYAIIVGRLPQREPPVAQAA